MLTSSLVSNYGSCEPSTQSVTKRSECAEIEVLAIMLTIENRCNWCCVGQLNSGSRVSVRASVSVSSTRKWYDSCQIYILVLSYSENKLFRILEFL